MTWQAGDLALCVRSGTFPDNPTHPGCIYTVKKAWVRGARGLCLAFVEVPSRGQKWLGHSPDRFRKIEPHTPDAEDAETIRLLKGVHA